MADGTPAVVGTGDVIWTEDVSDARGKIARSKIALGDLDADDGDVSFDNPMPITGTVSIIPSGTQNVNVNNTVTATIDSGTVTVNGDVTVDNIPGADDLVDATANPSTSMIGTNALVFNGSTWDRLRVQNKRVAQNSVAIGTTAIVWTPASGHTFRLMGGSISVSVACSVLFEDNASGVFVFQTPVLISNTPYNFDLGNGYLGLYGGNTLIATSSVAADLTGTLYGCEELRAPAPNG